MAQEPARAPKPPRSRLVPLALVLLGAALAITFALTSDASAWIGRALAWLEALSHTPWAIPLAIVLFVVLAMLGAPQILLIPPLVAIFGPWAGFFYSWIGKIIACALGFWIGRRFGARAVLDRAGPNTTLLMEELARHGFLASTLVRLAPTVPSIFVNIAAGCTPMGFVPFIAGAALGSIPKMALIAFAGHAMIQGASGAGIHTWISAGGALLLMALVTWLGRRWMKRRTELAAQSH